MRYARQSPFGDVQGLRSSSASRAADLPDREPLLGERVAVADRDGVVRERLLVDRERERRADLVLAAVAAADRAALVVLDDVRGAQLLVQRARLPTIAESFAISGRTAAFTGAIAGWSRSTVRSRPATCSSS